jgi:hypothetical protein
VIVIEFVGTIVILMALVTPLFWITAVVVTAIPGEPLLNYTWPGRIHLIVKGVGVSFYLTVWLFRRRFHVCKLKV